MLIGLFNVNSFRGIIETEVFFDGEDFYFIDGDGDTIEVTEAHNRKYDYTI